MTETVECDCLIAGAGPAGLAAALAAAEAGQNVAVAEYLPSPGRKLLASGAGKCNLANALPVRELAARFRCGTRFVRPALYAYPPEQWRKFLAESGVPTVTPDGFHCFPKSMRAGDVLDALLRHCRQAGVHIYPDAPLTKLTIESGRVTGGTAPNFRFQAKKVVLCCGGMGYPALGGRGSGYELARQAGHRIVPPVPALVGLRSPEAWASTLPGVLLPDTTVRFGANTVGRGTLLFTHSGVSGPAILDLSGSVARQLLETSEAIIECAFLSRSAAEIREWFELERKQNGTKQVKKLLTSELPAAFAAALCEVANVPGDTHLAQLRAGEREQLVTALAACPLRINATEGWGKAMATDGGVPTGEVNAGTLESRLVAGLFFAGEMFDVGAPCGGYNIQWAISSGRLAGAARA